MKLRNPTRYLIAFIILSAFLFGNASAEEKDSPFSPEEQKSFELIKKVKEFEKTLGLEETKNFLEFAPDVAYNILHYHEKTKMPFSYIDPVMIIEFLPYGNDKDNLNYLKSEMFDFTKYDIFINYCAIAGGMPITKKLLQTKPEQLIYTVIHEDWHDNANLPLHIEEASGNLIGLLGSWKFLNFDSQTIEKKIKQELDMADAINNVHDNLTFLSQKYSSGKIGKSQYFSEKEKIIKNFNQEMAKILNMPALGFNATSIAHWHSYYHYFPLIYKLFCALNKDINYTVAVLKNVPIKEPLWYGDDKNYFEKTRKAEKQIESYLEFIIKNEAPQTGVGNISLEIRCGAESSPRTSCRNLDS